MASATTVTATRLLLHQHGRGGKLSAATGRLLRPRVVQARHAGTARAPTNPERQGRLDGLQELAAGLDHQQVAG
ncbi:MAG TPA: hypothetical protein VI751_13370 [Actinomycetota bacterium]